LLELNEPKAIALYSIIGRESIGLSVELKKPMDALIVHGR